MSKIPEGATHHSSAAPNRLEAYWRPDGSGGYDCWAIGHGDGHWQKNGHPLPTYAKRLPVVPSTWNGPEDGLPPVGVEVEFNDPDGENPTAWIRGEVRYLSEVSVVVRHEEFKSGRIESLFFPKAAKFRPVRTAEQLAAEEREQQIEKMLTLVNCAPWEAPHYKLFAERLYDAGARLPSEGSKT